MLISLASLLETVALKAACPSVLSFCLQYANLSTALMFSASLEGCPGIVIAIKDVPLDRVAADLCCRDLQAQETETSCGCCCRHAVHAKLGQREGV